MALQTTFSTNPVKTIIASESALTSTQGVGVNNITGGAAYIHSVEVTNASFGTDVYIKLYNAASAVAGTTDADIILLCKSNTLALQHQAHPLRSSSFSLKPRAKNGPAQGY